MIKTLILKDLRNKCPKTNFRNPGTEYRFEVIEIHNSLAYIVGQGLEKCDVERIMKKEDFRVILR